MSINRFTFKYTISGASEKLIVKEFKSFIAIDRKYNNGYCLLDLAFDQNIVPISKDIKNRVTKFKTAYRKYYKTKNYDLISDMIIHAATDRMTIGRVIAGIPMSLETSDIDKLIDFIMVQVYKNDLMMTY